MFFNDVFPEKTEHNNNSTLEIDSNFIRFHTYPTPKEVYEIGLLGLPKTFPLTGEKITVDYVTSMLVNAINSIEMEGLIISPITTTKQEDFHDGHFINRYFAFIVDKYPVIDVESVILLYPHTSTATPMMKYIIPRDWITFDRNKINVVASTGLLAPTQLGMSPNPVLAMWSNTSWRPNSVTITYKAGFEADKIPYILWKLLIDIATYDILADVGPMLFPVTAMNVGIDSVSQSSQLPGPRVLTEKMELLSKRIAKNKAIIKGYFGQSVNMEFAGI